MNEPVILNKTDNVSHLENLPGEILIYILLLTGDVQYFARLNKTSKKIKNQLTKLEARLLNSYWLPLYCRDARKNPVNQQMSSKELYKQFLDDYKKSSGLSLKHRKLFSWVRSGDIESIKQTKYHLGNWFHTTNDFADVYDNDKNNAILLASKYERFNILNYIYQLMLKNIFTEKETDSIGRNSNHWAANCNIESQFIFLEKDKVDETVQSTGSTMLHSAAKYGHVKLARKLISLGADLNFANLKGSTPIMVAAYYGNLAVVEELLAAGASLEPAKENVLSPLAAAVVNGHVEVVKKLAALKINKQLDYVLTPYHLAIQSGHIEIVKILLEAGQRYDSRIICLVAEKGNIEILKLFMQDTDLSFFSEGLLHTAANHDHYDMVKFLLHNNLKADLGKTYLFSLKTYAFFKLWNVKELNKTKPLIDQIIIILETSDSYIKERESLTFFFVKNSIIAEFKKIKCENPGLNKAELKKIINKYQKKISNDKYNFIIENILNDDIADSPLTQISLEIANAVLP